MPSGLRDVLALQGVALPSTNITSGATVGFEEKEGAQAAFARVSSATYHTAALFSLAAGTGTKDVTAAQAKTLPGVNEDEELTLICRLYMETVAGNRSGGLDVIFYNEDGQQVGDEITIETDTLNEWVTKRKGMTVPTGATRINFYLRAECDGGETMQIWMSGIKITR